MSQIPIESLDSSTATPLPELPFKSLDGMLSYHRRLLRMTRHATPPPDIGATIKNFLAAGVALGRFLDDPPQRQTAQGLLDYWAIQRASYPHGSGDNAALFEAILDPFDEQSVNTRVQHGDAALNDLNENELDVARKILMRMTQLDEESNSFKLQTVPRGALISVDEPDRVTRILGGLESAGVVRWLPGETDAMDQYMLSEESLLRVWPRLENWLQQRQRFRRAAKFWAEQGRREEALFDAGPLLQEALSYRDLGELEQEFADAGRVRQQKKLKRKNLYLWGAIAILTMLLIVSVGAMFAYRQTLARAEQNHRLAEKNWENAREQLAEAQRQQRLYALDQMQLTTVQEDLDKVPGPGVENELLKAPSINLRKWGYRAQKNPEDTRISASLLVKLKSTEGVLYPGQRIGSENGMLFGSAGFYVVDPNKNRYLVAPKFLLEGRPGTVIQRFGSEVDKPGKRVGIIADFGQSKAIDLTALAFAKLDANVQATNEIPGSNLAIGGLAGEVLPNDKIMMYGSGYGKRTGMVKRLNLDGTIITDRISTPGDAGAPVVTEDGLLIGLVVASDGKDESTVIPVRHKLEQLGLRLLDREAHSANPKTSAEAFR